MNIDDLAAEPADRWHRDRWGRPLVVPPEGGTPVPYGRPSGFGIVLEDRFGLNKWQTRMACLGLTQRRDLAAQFAAATDDRTRDDLIAQAQEAAGASTGANMGSALHTFTEHVDLGRDVQIPAPWDADIAAYVAALADHGYTVDPAAVELDVVCDELRLAGTADRILEGNGRRFIADLKTGKKITDPALGYAVQLAVYARSARYHHDTGGRSPLNVDLDVGLIIHLPAGQARCDIHEVDLGAAWDLAQLAAEVKAAQKRRGVVTLTKPSGSPASPPTGSQPDPSPAAVVPTTSAAAGDTLTAALRAELVDLLRRADPPALARIAADWPPGVPTFKASRDHTRDQLRAIERVVVDVCGFQPDAGFRVPTTDEVVARLKALPKDLLAAVESTAKAEGIPHVSHGWEHRHLMRVDGLCREGEHEHAARVQEVDEAVADLDADLAAAIVRHVTVDLVPFDALLAGEAEQIVCLAAAATWLLDPDLAINPQAWAELIDRKGGKRAVLDTAKQIAARHELPAPRSTDAVAASPVLAALVAAG